jgi:hypothetical protein
MQSAQAFDKFHPNYCGSSSSSLTAYSNALCRSLHASCFVDSIFYIG